MAQSPGERKEATDDLRYLVVERSERQSKYRHDPNAQLDAVE